MSEYKIFIFCMQTHIMNYIRFAFQLQPSWFEMSLLVHPTTYTGHKFYWTWSKIGFKNTIWCTFDTFVYISILASLFRFSESESGTHTHKFHGIWCRSNPALSSRKSPQQSRSRMECWLYASFVDFDSRFNVNLLLFYFIPLLSPNFRARSWRRQSKKWICIYTC